MKLKKIGIFCSYFGVQTGGTELFVEELIEWLIKNDFYPILVRLGSQDTQKDQGNYSIITIKTNVDYVLQKAATGQVSQFSKLIYHIRRFYNRPLAQKITEAFLENEVKSVHLHNLFEASYLLPQFLSNRGINVTAFCHSFEWLEPRFHPIKKNPASLLQLIRKHQALSARKYIQQYVANSEFMKQSLYEILGQNIKCEVLYPLMPNIAASNPKIKSSRHDSIHCVYSGSLETHKGIVNFIEQIKRLGITWLKVHVYGDGPLRSVVENYAKQLVIYHGRVSREQMMEVFAEADFTIIPSLCDESFGRVVFESISSGCRVLAAKRGGLVEQARIFPEILLYEPNDINSLDSQLSVMKELILEAIDPTKAITEFNEKNYQTLKRLMR